MHKESTKPRTAKATIAKKEPGKKQQISENSSPSKTSFFGSLKRGVGGATSTPKSTKSNDVGKTKENLQLRNKPPDKEKKPWYRSTANGILGKDLIKSSNSSLNVTPPKFSNVTERKRRPLTLSLTPNVTARRGQNAKLDGQNLPDNLSRTSSITNLEVEQRAPKGAKPRKSSSRDRIDKIGDKKNDKKGLTKNNNKLDSGESPYPSIDSLQEEEFHQLRRQLQEMAQEKSNLALQLGEQKGQLNILQKEILSLKSFQEDSNVQLEHLIEENTALRNRLRDVAHSPLSDNEKQQLLYETHQRHHNSAPASIAANLIDEGNGGDITACPTPDWDKHSSSNVSEVSVACLQDKINQMQETHYSTNEELQATLQELTDLQRQLTELQQENERLNEEKTLMFDSLCRQTERLNDSRSEVESLKQLLYREKDETGQHESAIEREQKLVGLLKSAQEEKQGLMLKLEQINNEIQDARAGIIEKDDRIKGLSERVRTLESTLDAKHAEHKLIDQELAQAKDQCSGKQIEINRLTDLLDNARTKITELEQDRTLSDKSELEELLDSARKEKDSLESEVAHLKEQLAIGKNEIEKLKEQVSILQEECKVTRNNARTKQNDLEYKCEKLLLDKNKLSDQLLEFQEAVNELQVQSQCQLEDKRQLSSVLSETQRNLSEAERKNLSLESELEELKKVRAEEVEEWEKFQNDLLTSVRVANDFKTEAQQELQRMILENKSYREKERQLKTEIEKLKGNEEELPSVTGKTDMEDLLGLSKRSRDRSRRNTDSASSGNKQKKPGTSTKTVPGKEDKTKEKKPEASTRTASPAKEDKNKQKKPDLLTKTVKKREKPPARNKKIKTLSVEEELLLKSLNDWYEHIDKDIPEDKLTEEQRVVKKLKTLYEDDSLKEKPVAHKPKNMLAISKPLLDSVFLNPKLEEIAKDPNMPTIEEMDNVALLSDAYLPELRNSPQVPGRHAGVRSVDLTKAKQPKRTSILGRSKSCDDLFGMDENHESPILYRSAETEDLRKDAPFVRGERESSILPSDSVSNPRYSDFASAINSNIRQKDIKEPDVVKVSRNSSVKFETLELIVASIPENATADQLTSEQKFAVKLMKALDAAERKNTLKKRKRKQVDISSPTLDSVKKNETLRNILQNPQIQSVRAGLHFMDPVRQSKSYQDISFNFNAGNENKSLASDESTLGDSYGFNRKSSLTGTFSSAEFDAETGLKSPFDSTKLSSFKDEKEEKTEDLLYNDTINKKNRGSKEVKNESIVPEKHESSLEYEDDTNRSHISTVISKKEYNTLLLGLARDRNRFSNLPDSEPPTFRVKSVDNTAIVDDSLEKNLTNYTPSNFKVTSDDDEINRSRTATVLQYKEYEALFDDSYDIDKNLSDIIAPPKEYSGDEPIYHKVQLCEDKSGKSHSVTDVPPEEHITLLKDAYDKNQVPELPPIFKVRTLEDSFDKNYCRVIPVEDHKATFKMVHSLNEEPPIFKVQISEDEVDKYYSTVISPPEEHKALFKYHQEERQFVKLINKEETLENEIDKNYSTLIIPPGEHNAVFKESPTLKVQTLEDQVDKDYSTVISPEEHKALFKYDDEQRQFIKLINKVQNQENEIDENYSTLIIAPEEHNAVFKEPPTFQVQTLEDQVHKEYSTVICPEEHKALFKYDHEERQFTKLKNKVHTLENEFDENYSTLIIPPEEHSVVFKESPTLKVLEDETKLNYSSVIIPPEQHRAVFKEPPIFKVQSVEDEVDRPQSVIVIPSKEYIAVFRKPKPELPTFKVESLEDEVDRNQSVTVIEPQEYTAVFGSSHEQNKCFKSQSTFKVKSLEGEADSQYATVLLPNEYVAVLDQSEFSDLTYNDTLNKKIIAKEQSININKEFESPAIPDIIVDLGTNSVQQKNEDSSQTPLYKTKEESDDDILDLSYGTSSWTDTEEGENPEYDYHAILKENRYGVVSPLNIRLSYKDVVKEIKTKFPTSKGASVDQSTIDELDESNTFLDDFFGTSRKMNKTDSSSDDVQDIDAEMEEIFEKYLHIPVSKVITQIGTENSDKTDEDEIPSATNFSILESQKDDAVSLDTNLDNKVVVEKYPQYKQDITLSGDEDLASEKTQPVVESVNENLCPISDRDPALKLQQKISIDGDSLSEKELGLIRTLENVRYSRPLSDLNENDLLLIEQLSGQYFPKSDNEENQGSNYDTSPSQDLKDDKCEPQNYEAVKDVAEPNNTGYDSESPNRNLIEEEKESDSKEENKIETHDDSNYNRTPVIPSLILTDREETQISDISKENDLKITEATDCVKKTPEIQKIQKDDSDDVNDLLSKMLISSHSLRGKIKQQKVELDDGRSNVTLRKTDFESVKNKFESIAKNNAEARQHKRQSLNPALNYTPPERRKVRSWAEHFERRSLDTRSAYEPVYENLESVSLQKKKLEAALKIDKKPLPVPRTKNLSSFPAENDDRELSVTENDTIRAMEMSDCKIMSESDNETISQEHPGADFAKINVPDVPEHSETSRVILKEPPIEEAAEGSGRGCVLGINKSEKFLGMREGNIAHVKDESDCLASVAETSFSAIAVAGKFEELDITKHPDDMEEIQTSCNDSHLNLFHLEAPSCDESDLSMFKSPEGKVYEDVSGTRKQKGYYNFAYLAEISDSESCDDVHRNSKDHTSLKENGSKPKIIDFVPLDEGTKPVFNKKLINDPVYDTLEREKTFQVLNIAASTGAVKKTTSHTENETAAPSNSRISFSAAKKVFETLVESNTENAARDKSKLEAKEIPVQNKSGDK